MRDAIMMLEQLTHFKQSLVLQDFYDYYGLVNGDMYGAIMKAAQTGDVVGAKKIISDHFSRGVDMIYFLDCFMRATAGDIANKRITTQQAIETYRAAVEVKGKLKLMPPETAVGFLFTLLMRAFHCEQQRVPVSATLEEAQSLFT